MRMTATLDTRRAGSRRILALPDRSKRITRAPKASITAPNSLEYPGGVPSPKTKIATPGIAAKTPDAARKVFFIATPSGNQSVISWDRIGLRQTACSPVYHATPRVHDRLVQSPDSHAAEYIR